MKWIVRWVAVALMLVGCRGTAKGTNELVIWHAYRGAEAAALAASAARFEAKSGTPVRLVSIPFDAFSNKLSVAIPRGNGPDLFIFAHDRVGDWAAGGLVERLGSWAKSDQLSHFVPTTVEPLVYQGELYGLPLAFKTLALYYDTTLVPQPPTTTDALIAQSKALKAKSPDVWGLGYPIDSLYFHAVWLHGYGASVYEGQSDTVTLATESSIASAAFARRLVTEGVLPDEITSALVTALFRKRKLAFVINGPWFKGELEGHDGWAVAPLPTVSYTGLQARPFLGVEAVLMSARSRHKALGWAFMQHLTADAEAQSRFVDGGQLVANHAAYEAAPNPFAAVFKAQAQTAVPLSNRPHMRQVWTPMQNALTSAVVRGDDAAEALREAVRSIEAKGR